MTSPSETIAKAMEGVTPGPWEAKQNAYGAVFIYGGETLTTSVGTDYKELVAGGNSHDTLKMENAAYIAACSPDVMRGILALARKADEKAAEAETMRAKAIANAQERNAAERKAEAMKRENDVLLSTLVVASEALLPFAAAVFNDNGDMSVDLSPASADDYIRAYFADRRARTLIQGEKQ